MEWLDWIKDNTGFLTLIVGILTLLGAYVVGPIISHKLTIKRQELEAGKKPAQKKTP